MQEKCGSNCYTKGLGCELSDDGICIFLGKIKVDITRPKYNISKSGFVKNLDKAIKESFAKNKCCL